MPFYGEKFYGEKDFFYLGPLLYRGIKKINCHYNQNRHIYTIYWTIPTEIIITGSDKLNWALEVSDTPDFVTPTIYNENNVNNYFDQGPVKGCEIVFSEDDIKNGKTYYLRLFDGLNNYSEVLKLDLTRDLKTDYAELLFQLLPDTYLYSKDILNLPEDQRNSLLYTIFLMYSNTLDIASVDSFSLFKAQSLYTCDNTYLEDFGKKFNWKKPKTMIYLWYRHVLQGCYESLIYQGSERAIYEVVKRFTGVNPIIIKIRDDLRLYCVDNQDEENTSYLGDNEIIINSREVLGYGIRIKVINPCNYNIDYSSLRLLINYFIPAQVYSSL